MSFKMNSDDLASLKNMLNDQKMKQLEDMLKSSLNSKSWSAGFVNTTTMVLLLLGLIGSFITAYINIDKSISLIDNNLSRLSKDVSVLKQECKETTANIKKIENKVMALEYKTGIKN